MRSPEEAKETARRFIDEVFNQRNLKHAEEMLTEDFVEHSPPFPDFGTDKPAPSRDSDSSSIRATTCTSRSSIS